MKTAAANYTLVEGKNIPQVRQVQTENYEQSPATPRAYRDTPVYRDGSLSNSGEQEEATDLEEVYICNCCGVTRELKPASKMMSCFKSSFFVFNFMVLIFGFANLGMGLWLRIDPKVYEIHKYIETQNFTIAGWILLFCGFIACLMAFSGFAAANRQRVCPIIYYLLFMIPLTLAFVGSIVLLTVYGLGQSLERVLTKEIYEQIRRRSMNVEQDFFRTSDAAQFLDFVQVKMRCCGATDFRDYSKLGMVVPSTCYSIDRNFINAPGCGRAIRELLDLRAGLAIGFATGSVLSQLAAVILSALILCSINQLRSQPNRTSARPTLRDTMESLPLDLYQQRPRSRTPIVS